MSIRNGRPTVSDKRKSAKQLLQHLYDHHVREYVREGSEKYYLDKKGELSVHYKVGMLETILELKMADVPEMYKSMQDTVEFALKSEKAKLSSPVVSTS